MFSFEVDLFPAAKESKEVKTLQLQGAPTQMKVFRDSISLMVNNDMIQLLEYDGINGLVVAGTVKVTDVKKCFGIIYLLLNSNQIMGAELFCIPPYLWYDESLVYNVVHNGWCLAYTGNTINLDTIYYAHYCQS